VLSKWTQRYEIYKELQKKIDEKLMDMIMTMTNERVDKDNNRIYFCTYFRETAAGVNDRIEFIYSP
jgi:hypothetical protein